MMVTSKLFMFSKFLYIKKMLLLLFNFVELCYTLKARKKHTQIYKMKNFVLNKKLTRLG